MSGSRKSASSPRTRGGWSRPSWNPSSTAGSITGPTAKLAPLQSGNADVGLAVDPGSKYLFVTETGQNALRAFSIGTTGGLTNLSGSPYTTGQGPKGIVVDSTGSNGSSFPLVPPMNTSVSNIQIFRCAQSVVNQTALVDVQTRQAVDFEPELKNSGK